MTALVIIITGAYLDPANLLFIENNQGGALIPQWVVLYLVSVPLSCRCFFFAFTDFMVISRKGVGFIFLEIVHQKPTNCVINFYIFGSIITATNKSFLT